MCSMPENRFSGVSGASGVRGAGSQESAGNRPPLTPEAPLTPETLDSDPLPSLLTPKTTA